MISRRVAFGAILALVAFTQLLHGAEYSGSVVHIVDGDTFDMDVGATRLRVRFCGIDSLRISTKQSAASVS